MWSQRFLIAGLVSGVAVAVIALAAIWLVVFAADGGGDPNWTPANIVKFGVPGIVAYPLGWYLLIYRKRDYSASRTWLLIAATYTGVATLAITLLFIGMLFPAFQLIFVAVSTPRLESLWVIAGALLAPVMAAMLALIVAGLIGLAYVVTAAPMAFLHRFALIRLFAEKSGAQI